MAIYLSIQHKNDVTIDRSIDATVQNNKVYVDKSAQKAVNNNCYPLYGHVRHRALAVSTEAPPSCFSTLLFVWGSQ